MVLTMHGPDKFALARRRTLSSSSQRSGLGDEAVTEILHCGAGAIGGIIAALLARSGAMVSADYG